jgi:hypothetical protein
VRDLLEADFDVRPAADAQKALLWAWRSTSTAAGTWRAMWVERSPGSFGLDVSLLNDRVLDRLPAGTEVELTRAALGVLLAACDADGGVLFALPAPELETVIAIADAGEVVPAKHVPLTQAGLGHLPARSQRGQTQIAVGLDEMIGAASLATRDHLRRRDRHGCSESLQNGIALLVPVPTMERLISTLSDCPE